MMTSVYRCFRHILHASCPLLDLLLSIFNALCGNHLLDLCLGESLQLGTTTNELSTKVDVGNGTLAVEGLEVSLDGGCIVS